MGEWIKVDVDGGQMGAYLAQPDRKSAPGIVMLQEIFGVNAAMQAKADEFAAAGYNVLVPDIFWRMQERVDLGYTEDDRAQAFGFMQKLDFPKALDDIAAAFSALGAMEDVSGQPAFIGYCLGGKLAVLAGAKVGNASAVISFYGVKLDENIAQIKGMSCPVSIHVGDDDAHIPMETVRLLQSELEGSKAAEVVVYPGAKHGFFNKLRSDVFDADAAQKAWDRVLEVLPAPN